MRLSRCFVPTLKEDPSDAEVVSHRLMLRAGMICKLAAGIYDILPLGLRVLRKIEGIIRDEMNRAGALEVLLPAVQPAELWKESGRWDRYGPELLRFQDRHQREFCMGPTHEEVVTDVVRRFVRSYRQLPLNLYQIQTKFRDEVRPRFGLMRGREFSMKDAYSFDADEAGAQRSYARMFEAYGRIFRRCGLEFRAVEAESGAIGGSFSSEFMVLADSGEDEVVHCDACQYAANSERAEIGEAVPSPAGAGGRGSPSAGPAPSPSKVATPGRRSVEEVSAFLGVGPERIIKTMILETSAGTIAAIVRGDHELNEAKVKRGIGADWVALAGPDEVRRVTGSEPGFAGPLGLDIPILADRGIALIEDGVTGANEEDAHFVHVSGSRDLPGVRWTDLRKARAGDPCPRCPGRLGARRGIEVGHVFRLGTKYSHAMGAHCLDEKGDARPIVMGCYGIGVGRTMAAAIEQNHDEDGIRWPLPLAPFEVIVLPVNSNDPAVVDQAERIYGALAELGVEVILDDRPERPGVKFKDADLVGFPFSVVVGSKGIREGRLEIKCRRSGERVLATSDEIASRTISLLEREREPSP